jgi:hypothetical protein
VNACHTPTPLPEGMRLSITLMASFSFRKTRWRIRCAGHHLV